MRRHLVVVIVGMVAGALLLAGAGTYLLAGRGVRADDAASVLRQAREVAAEVPFVLAVKDRSVRRGVLEVLRVAAGARFVTVGPAGRVRGALPSGVTAASLDAGRLLAGTAVSGNVDGGAFAAVPVPSVSARTVPKLGRSGQLVVVVAQQLPGAALGLTYLLLVSGATLAVAVVAAVLLSRRITSPLVHAVGATERIARGDLDVRVADRPGGYPELSSLTASINAMAAGLARSRALQRQFLLSVSHDLRTPLTSILGYAEAIADGTVRDPGAAAGVIAAESRRLARLVGDLLELARLDSEQFSLRLTDTDVGEVVRETAEGFRPATSDAGVELAVTVPPPGMLRALVDRDRLSQVVANLVENAYSFAAGRVQVWAGRADGSVTLYVDDDGPGIPPGEQPRVFERLYQVEERPAARQAGTGLGLAIVAELVAAMGGSVSVRSPTSPAGGTRMVVRLEGDRTTG